MTTQTTSARCAPVERALLDAVASAAHELALLERTDGSLTGDHERAGLDLPLRVFTCGHDGPRMAYRHGEALVALCPACEVAWYQGRSFREVARAFVPAE